MEKAVRGAGFLAKAEHLAKLPMEWAVLHRAPRPPVMALLQAYPGGADEQAMGYITDLGIDTMLTLSADMYGAQLQAILEAHPFALNVDAAEADAAKLGPHAMDIIMEHYNGALNKLVLPSKSTPYKATVIQDLHKKWGKNTLVVFDLLSAIRNRDLSSEALHEMIELDKLLGRPLPCVQAMDDSGNLPIHRAAQFLKFNPECIKTLARAYPEGVRAHNIQGCLPAYLAIDAHADATMLRTLLSEYPHAAIECFDVACDSAVGAEEKRSWLVELLRADSMEAEARPQLWTHPTARFPKVAALMREFEEDSVPAIMEVEFKSALLLSQEAAKLRKATAGMSPADKAEHKGEIAEAKAWGLVVEHLDTYAHDKEEESLRRDPEGLSAMHHAAKSDASEAIAALCAACPLAAQAVDAAGKTPLHYVVESKAGRASLNTILGVFPTGRDMDWVMAYQEEMSSEKGLLLRLCEEAKWGEVMASMPFPFEQTIEKHDGKVPLQFAMDLEAPPNVLAAVIGLNPDAVGLLSDEAGQNKGIRRLAEASRSAKASGIANRRTSMAMGGVGSVAGKNFTKEVVM